MPRFENQGIAEIVNRQSSIVNCQLSIVNRKLVLDEVFVVVPRGGFQFFMALGEGIPGPAGGHHLVVIFFFWARLIMVLFVFFGKFVLDLIAEVFEFFLDHAGDVVDIGGFAHHF